MKGAFPTIWKAGTSIPLSKDKDQKITILPVVSEPMERIVHLNTGTHAYRHNHSTCSALTVVTTGSKMTGAVLLHLSAAFDVIDHNLLIHVVLCCKNCQSAGQCFIS